jgi:hypothetical protein
MITVTIKWVKRFGLTHRFVVAVTITPNWFLRNILFVRVRTIYFEGYGDHWKRMPISSFPNQQQPVITK